ncbi:MAG: energy-coupling factor ABC transporter ATP-binding protein, partial [Thermoplasmata archaeon]
TKEKKEEMLKSISMPSESLLKNIMKKNQSCRILSYQSEPEKKNPKGIVDREEAVGVERDDSNIRPSVMIESIDFGYTPYNPVFSNFSIGFKGPGCCVIVGENGSGKSTLLKLIAGFLKPQAGRILKNRKSSMCFQNADLIFMEQSVEEELLSVPGIDKKSLRKLVSKVGLEGKEKKHPFHLSGGERQRLAVLIASFTDSEIVLLDEPTKGLDPANFMLVLDVIAEVMEKKLVLISTNDERILEAAGSSNVLRLR